MINFEKILNSSKGESKQFLVLTKHFFNRLFQNDIVSFEEQMIEKFVAFLAIISIFSAHFANTLVNKYLFFPDRGTSWVEKCYFIFFFMILIGFITVVEWDLLFPDSRDYSNLIPLPLKLRTLFLAKFTSLFLFVGIFALGANSFATLVFWFCLPKWISNSLLFSIRFILVHVISVLASSIFIFFTLIALAGLLMSVFNYKIFNRISIFIRAILMILFIFMMLFFVGESLSIPKSFSSLPTLKQSNSLFIYLFPPMWFTGLYETLLGTSDPVFFTLSKISLLGVILPIIAFFLFSAIGYRRQLHRIQELEGRKIHFFKLKKFFSSIFNSIFLRNSIQRSIFYFFGKTLRRSMIHRMRLISYVAVSIGLILIIIMVAGGFKPKNLSEINKTLLSIPLIISFFLLIGLKSIVDIPVELPANWIFKLTEIENKKHYFIGLRKGIFFFTLFPLFILLFILYSLLWGWKISLLHSLYGLTISTLLMEFLFINYRKIPFTCSYLPGKAKIQYFLFGYIFSFVLYIYTMIFIEKALLKNPSRFLIFFAIVSGIFIAIKIYQNFFFYKKNEIIYEEEPEPVMISLGTE